MRTRLCDVLGIEVPIIQAAIWPATTPELVAAVGEAGAIGSLGAVFGSADRVRREIDRVRVLTDRPFIVNHVVPQLDPEAFEATLEARPAAVSFALGDPGALVERVRAAGIVAIHQVHTPEQARVAAERGVDVIIAQGAEAGGQGLSPGIGGLALLPQVVDAVALPVVAAGGIADGRGLAAALALGAAGVNIGTRFLASDEADSHPDWRRRIVQASSEEAVRFEAWRTAFPRSSDGAYAVVPRVLRTAFVDRHEGHEPDGPAIRESVMAALADNRAHEVLPFTGQSAGLVDDVLPAAEIVRRMVDGAHEALDRARASAV